MKVPGNYLRAAWRCTTAADRDADSIGVGFNLEGGEVVRLALTLREAELLADSIRDHIAESSSLSLGDGGLAARVAVSACESPELSALL